MNAVRASIFQISPKEWMPGHCWVCEQPVLLKFRDITTGTCVGSCCLEAMLYSDRALHFADGIRKPTVEDNIPDH